MFSAVRMLIPFCWIAGIYGIQSLILTDKFNDRNAKTETIKLYAPGSFQGLGIGQFPAIFVHYMNSCQPFSWCRTEG